MSLRSIVMRFLGVAASQKAPGPTAHLLHQENLNEDRLRCAVEKHKVAAEGVIQSALDQVDRSVYTTRAINRLVAEIKEPGLRTAAAAVELLKGHDT